MDLRPRRADERGLTLIEVLVSTSLTLIVLVMGYGILTTTRSTAAAVGNRSQNSTDARLAIDALEANLRFANAIWVCGPVVGANTCPAPTVTTPSSTTMTVENAAGSSNAAQPACAHWTLPSTGLTETSTTGGTTRVTAVMPGTSPYTGTTGFTLPLPRLAQIDLLVNEEVVGVIASDAVAVHDLVAPNNLTTAQAPVASTTPCT